MAAMVAEAADFSDAIDGPALVSNEDGDEEIFASDDSGAPKDQYTLILEELEVLMMDEGLNARVDDFTTKHCHEFDDSDENKLCYTSLFAEYTALIEAYIEERLGASVKEFDMAGFCATLAERAKGCDELPPSLEMLHSMADFDAFKQLMLSTKLGLEAEAAGGELCVSGGALSMDAAGAGLGLPGLDDDADDADAVEMPGLGLAGVSIGKKA